MSRKTILISVILLVVLVTSGAYVAIKIMGNRQTTFGSPIDTGKGQVIEFSSLFSDPEVLLGKNIIVEGKVGQVCQTSGCWVIVTDGTNQLFTQFYDFTVNLSAGTRVRLQGELRTQNNAPYLVGQGLEVLP